MDNGEQAAPDDAAIASKLNLLYVLSGLVAASGACFFLTNWAAVAVARQRRDKHPLWKAVFSKMHLVDTSQGLDAALQDDAAARLEAERAAESKSARSKERRRRGKDPVKEIMKGGKRGKVLLDRLVKAEKSSAQGANVVPKIVEPPESSAATSSRSSSLMSSSHSPKAAARPLLEQDVASPDDMDTPKAYEGAGAPLAQVLGISASAPAFENNKETLETQHPTPLRPSRTEFNALSALDTPPALGETSNLSQASTSRSESASTSDLETQSAASSAATGSTSPPASLVSSKAELPGLHASRSAPSPSPDSSAAWAWSSPCGSGSGSGSGSTSGPGHDGAAAYQKPPRFRSKSRNSSSRAASPLSASESAPYSLPFASAFALPADTPEEPAAGADGAPVEYPTLNPSPSPTPPTAGPSTLLSPTLPHTHLNNNNNSTRRAPTPRRTPTPSATPPPGSVSEKTQLKAVRGALEASRTREEKARADAERLHKECELMKWRWGEDIATWRRKEAEYHAQMHFLMHQLQGYAAFAASHSHSQPQAGPSAHLHVPQPQTPYGPQPNGQTISSHSPASTPHTPQSPTTAAPFPPFPHPMLSPFAAYPMPTTTPHPHPHPNANANPNLFSLFFPAPLPTSASASEGESSPDMSVGVGSPLQMRGRRRMRDDGWIGEKVHGVDGEEDADEDGEVNEALADAIFKRPESIRGTANAKTGMGTGTGSAVASGSGHVYEKEVEGSLNEEEDAEAEDEEREQRPPIFTWPSLTDFGNVNGTHVRVRERTPESEYAHEDADMHAPKAVHPYAVASEAQGQVLPPVIQMPLQDDSTPTMEKRAAGDDGVRREPEG